MALLNEAFALGQQGQRAEARAVYARVLQEFPESSIAQAALNLMEPAA
jgi:TolA-binding protein